MQNWLTQYWYIVLIAAVVVAALIVWRLLARRTSEPAVRNDAPPAAPLQPVRPEIVAAQPAQFSAAPAPVPAVAVPPLVSLPIATATGAPDNLSLLKGVGPKVKAILTDLGVTRFDQIAAWDAEQIAAIDAHMGAFAGRITRDNWVDQAGYLARGDTAGFEAKYGALGSAL